MDINNTNTNGAIAVIGSKGEIVGILYKIAYINNISTNYKKIYICIFRKLLKQCSWEKI